MVNTVNLSKYRILTRLNHAMKLTKKQVNQASRSGEGTGFLTIFLTIYEGWLYAEKGIESKAWLTARRVL
jgi:hypothetical protein